MNKKHTGTQTERIYRMHFPTNHKQETNIHPSLPKQKKKVLNRFPHFFKNCRYEKEHAKNVLQRVKWN